MPRRFFVILLSLLLFIAPAAHADLDQYPSRETFSMAHYRLQQALGRERVVSWNAAVSPSAMGEMEGGALEAMIGMLGTMDLQGLLATYKDGGMLEATANVGGKPVWSMGQATHDGRTAINLTGDWLSIAQGMEAEASALLELDDFGRSLLEMDYAGIRSGDTPFLSTFYKQGLTLWALASPYSSDNNRLSTPSGWTSHANTYEIDTQALRTILTSWADGLTMDGLSLGFAGTDLSAGVDAATFDAFVARVRAFAQTVEVTKPIKLSLTFGEGDVLRTAKGSGTLSSGGKRTGVSYSYTCSLSNTRITRKYNIDFQPEGMDTISLTCTWLTSSNGKSSGAHEVSLSASGKFDGKPYRIKANVDLVNKFSLGDGEVLTENITGKMTGSLRYDDVLVADVTVKRDSLSTSKAGFTTAIDIQDGYDVLIKDDSGTKFAGLLTLAYSVPEGPPDAASPVDDATRLEEMDFMALEILRDTLHETLSTARQRLIQSLPSSVISALLTAY